MKDPRKEKIRELKNKIKVEQDALVEHIKTFNPEEEVKKPEEEQKASKTEFNNKREVIKLGIENLREELKQTRMNKYSSSFLEWIPSSPNRRMRKAALEYKRKRFPNKL